MDLSYSQAKSTIRVSLSHETTDIEINLALAELVESVVSMRRS